MVARRELPGSLRETIRPVGYGERKCRCQHRSERRGENQGDSVLLLDGRSGTQFGFMF